MDSMSFKLVLAVILISSVITLTTVEAEIMKTQIFHLPMKSISLSLVDIGKWKNATYSWNQIIGSDHLTLLHRKNKTVTIINPKVGFYAFQVHISLANNQSVFSRVVPIEIFPKINHKPRANAGGERKVYLPAQCVKIIGSGSSDDSGIVRYRWQADKNNPAGLEIVGDSDKQSNLSLRKLSAGRFTFRLMVEDSAGMIDFDQMTLIIEESKDEENIIQIHFMANLRNFTYMNLKNFRSQVYLIVSKSITNSKINIKILQFQQDHSNGYAYIEFHVTNGTPEYIFAASTIIKILRPIILDDLNIFMYPVVQITSPGCSRSCFIHGYCDQKNRRCVCDMFWISNLWKDWVNNRSSKDCEWNIFYTSAIGLAIVFIIFLCCRQLYRILWYIPSCGLTPTEIT